MFDEGGVQAPHFLFSAINKLIQSDNDEFDIVLENVTVAVYSANQRRKKGKIATRKRSDSDKKFRS